MTTLRSGLSMIRDGVLDTVAASALTGRSKRALKSTLWLAGVIAAASCAPSTATVRSEGSRLLACPEVNVVWQSDLDYEAKGCGKMVSMRCDQASCRGLAAPSKFPVSDLAEVPVFATKNEPPPGCIAMGVAEGKDDTWGTPKYEVALDRLRRIAYERGANYVTLDTVRDTISNSLLVGGRLVKCPTEVMTHAAPSTCVPDCSPGFVCVNASCVSACNPPCTATQQCGGDRMCHTAR